MGSVVSLLPPVKHPLLKVMGLVNVLSSIVINAQQEHGRTARPARRGYITPTPETIHLARNTKAKLNRQLEEVELPTVEDATEADVSTNGLMETFEAEIAATYNADDDHEMETIMEDSTTKAPASKNGSLQYPRINIKGNEWMAFEFKETPRASLQEMATAFANEEDMRDYWFA